MNKKTIIIIGIIAVIIVLFFAVKIIKKQDIPIDYLVVEGDYEKINIIGETAEKGVADPSIEYDKNGVGWMTYSAVDGISSLIHVHTYLAKTTDNGQTWTYVKEINPSINGEITLDGQIIKGVWWNEVSTLVHDPDDPGKEWKLYWHKYFSKGKISLGAENRMLQYGWIAYKYASTPEGLADAEEIPLFGAGPFPPKPYSTKINLSQLHPNLNEFIVYTEPGSLYKDGIIYLTLQGHVIKNEQNIAKIVLIASDDHGETWRYVNTLVENKDARAFGASYFTASSLVRENNQFFLFVSPENPESKEKSHLGTVIFEFEDIAQGILKKDRDEELIVHKYLKPSLANGGGQGDYDEQNTYGGIMIPQTNISAYPKVGEIYNTKQKIVDSEEWSNPQKVEIIGYNDDAMEPFISPDGQYLFFNNKNDSIINTDLHYIKKIDSNTFQYLGKLQGTNTDSNLECCPTMDINGNFYFTSTRISNVTDPEKGYVPIIYGGYFDGNSVKNVRLIKDIEYGERGWINGDCGVSPNGDTLYIGQSFIGENYNNFVPLKSKFRLAKKLDNEFKIDSNLDYFFNKINGDDTEIEYASAISYDGLEIYFTRLKSNPYNAKIYRSIRQNINEPFGEPEIISSIAKEGEDAFVEAPTITKDGKTLYYHKLDGKKFSIYKVTRRVESVPCTDSDNGKDYFVKGETTFCNKEESEEAGHVGCTKHEDFCHDDINLWEYYCEDNKLKKEKVECKNGCSVGICLR